MPQRRRAGRGIVTLSSDIGWVYAAQMKAVLAHRIGPDRILDLAHDLPPHAIREAAVLFRAMAERFPPGAVHVCVVDPGVGGRRAPVAVQCRNGSVLIGPDNGVLYPLAERWGISRVVRIEPSRVEAKGRVGATFDGRDLFAPAAARVASGESVSRLGKPWPLQALQLAVPRPKGSKVMGEVLHVDRFGNLITNIPSETVPKRRKELSVRWKRRALGRLPLVTSYESLGRGRLGLLPSSFGLVELTVGEGNAAWRLGARAGDRLELGWSDGRTKNLVQRRRASQR